MLRMLRAFGPTHTCRKIPCNNVARCCVEMLRAFGQAFKLLFHSFYSQCHENCVICPRWLVVSADVPLYLQLQVLANLWSHSQLQQEIKREGWQNNVATQNAELARAPMDYEATSLPRTPEDRQRLDPNTRRFNYDSPQFPRDNRRTRDTLDNVNSETGVTEMSLESDRHRSWGEGLSQLPPPYASDDSYSRGSRSRDDIPMEEVRTSSRASRTNSLRDENFNANDRTIRLRDSGGGDGKDEDLWV